MKAMGFSKTVVTGVALNSDSTSADYGKLTVTKNTGQNGADQSSTIDLPSIYAKKNDAINVVELTEMTSTYPTIAEMCTLIGDNKVTIVKCGIYRYLMLIRDRENSKYSFEIEEFSLNSAIKADHRWHGNYQNGSITLSSIFSGSTYKADYALSKELTDFKESIFDEERNARKLVTETVVMSQSFGLPIPPYSVNHISHAVDIPTYFFEYWDFNEYYPDITPSVGSGFFIGFSYRLFKKTNNTNLDGIQIKIKYIDEGESDGNTQFESFGLANGVWESGHLRIKYKRNGSISIDVINNNENNNGGGCYIQFLFYNENYNVYSALDKLDRIYGINNIVPIAGDVKNNVISTYSFATAEPFMKHHLIYSDSTKTIKDLYNEVGSEVALFHFISSGYNYSYIGYVYCTALDSVTSTPIYDFEFRAYGSLTRLCGTVQGDTTLNSIFTTNTYKHSYTDQPNAWKGKTLTSSDTSLLVSEYSYAELQGKTIEVSWCDESSDRNVYCGLIGVYPTNKYWYFCSINDIKITLYHAGNGIARLKVDIANGTTWSSITYGYLAYRII